MRAHRLWWSLAAVAAAIAAIAIARWLGALASGAPVLYGEGAVAHAAVLARDRLEYTTGMDGSSFVAANYPPLYLHLAGLADPFVAGRGASIVSALFVAGAVARIAYRRSGALVAVALAAMWLASLPVVVWGAAVKPDLFALGLTVAAVLAAERRARPMLAGLLIALALWSKPTAALPAAALAVYLSGDPRALARFVVAGIATSAAVLVFAWTDLRAMFEHVVRWNALPWHADQAGLLVALLVLAFGAPLALYAVMRPRGAVAAYAVAAVGIALLGGREGATMNYLLDLTAAVALGLAARSDRLAPTPLAGVIAAQLLLAVTLLDPFGLASGRVTTGAWAAPERRAVVHALPGDLLVEDAGLLVVDGRAPRVDDLFLWSRLLEQGALPDGDRLVETVRARRFDAVVSEADLAHLGTAPLYERQRWAPLLVDAIVSGYRLERVESGLYVYRRAAP